MTKTPPRLTAEDAELLDQVILDVARRYRLRPADAQDFAQTTHVRLLERNYDVFRRFEGRCSKRGFLSVVVKRLALDWLNLHYGKWRPSTVARRLGPVAVNLDRLLHRDGYPETAAIAAEASRSDASVDALRMMVAQLPVRARRRLVAIDALDSERHLEFEDPVTWAEQRAAQRFISSALSQVVQELTYEERRMLTLRYRQRQTVRVIAQQMGVDAKRLYCRFDRTLQTLRHKLVAQGVTGPSSCAPSAH